MIPLNARIRDNDPRANGTERIVVGFVGIDLHAAAPSSAQGAYALVEDKCGMQSCIRLDRIHTDGKPHRSGWSVVALTLFVLAAAPALAAPPPWLPAPPTYTLITVTQGDDVLHSDGWATLGLCRDAESMARTGMTVVQAKKHSDDAAAAVAKANADWRAKHPPRAPRDDYERLIASANGQEVLEGSSVQQCGDHQICDEPSLWYLPPSFGILNSTPSAGDIKYAECVIVPGATP